MLSLKKSKFNSEFFKQPHIVDDRVTIFDVIPVSVFQLLPIPRELCFGGVNLFVCLFVSKKKTGGKMLWTCSDKIFGKC